MWGPKDLQPLFLLKIALFEDSCFNPFYGFRLSFRFNSGRDME